MSASNGIHLVGEEARKARQAKRLNEQTMTRGEVIALLDEFGSQFSTLVEQALDRGFDKVRGELPQIMAGFLVRFWEDQDMPPIKPPRRGPEGIVESAAGDGNVSTSVGANDASPSPEEPPLTEELPEAQP